MPFGFNKSPNKMGYFSEKKKFFETFLSPSMHYLGYFAKLEVLMALHFCILNIPLQASSSHVRQDSSPFLCFHYCQEMLFLHGKPDFLTGTLQNLSLFCNNSRLVINVSSYETDAVL